MVEQCIERYYISDHALDGIEGSMAEHMQRGWMVKCMQTVSNYLLVVYERDKEEKIKENID